MERTRRTIIENKQWMKANENRKPKHSSNFFLISQQLNQLNNFLILLSSMASSQTHTPKQSKAQCIFLLICHLNHIRLFHLNSNRPRQQKRPFQLEWKCTIKLHHHNLIQRATRRCDHTKSPSKSKLMIKRVRNQKREWHRQVAATHRTIFTD